MLTGVIPASRLSFSDMITCVEFQGCVASVLESPTLQNVRRRRLIDKLSLQMAYFV